MLAAITEEELEFCQLFYTPQCLIESLFSDFSDLSKEDPDQLGEYRLYQLPTLSYENTLSYNDKLSRKENFKRRENVGNCLAYGGRLWGKSFAVLILDIINSMLTQDGEEHAFSSIDAIHIRGIMEKVFTIVENHSFIKYIFHPKSVRNPNYRVTMRNGYMIESVNMNVQSKNPGNAFFSKHFRKLYIDEQSLESEEVYNKRIFSVSEFGCVYRIASMTDMTKYSPAGKIFFAENNQKFIVNLPQKVNPHWGPAQRLQAIQQFGGESSSLYKIFVNGEVVETNDSVFDMSRIRGNYLDDTKLIKTFEVNKENYYKFQEILQSLEPLIGSDKCYVCADIGETAPTEIIILFKVNNVYKYTHNITCFGLTHTEQTALFKFVIGKVRASVVSLDNSDGTGRAILRELQVVFPNRDQVFGTAFNEKLVVDFERDEQGKLIYKDGKLVEKEEYVSEWSIKRLKDLFYEDKIKTPFDYKLDSQLNSTVASRTANRTVYEVIKDEDHLLAAFRVFAIAEWITIFKDLKPMSDKKHGKGIF